MDTPDDVPSNDRGASTRRAVLAAGGLIGGGVLLQPVAGRVLDGGDGAEDAPETDAVAEAQPTAAEGEGWAQHSAGAGNAAHLPDDVAPTGDVTEAWRYRNDRFHEGVAVVDGTVYVGGKTLAAVDAGDGSERWQYEPEAPDLPEDEEGDTPEFGTPAVGHGRVYASVGFDVYDGGVPGEVLVAVDAGTGEERWRFDPAESTALSAPTVYDGTTDGETVYTRDGDTVHALAPDGSVRWTQSVGDGGSAYDPVPAANGRVFVPGADGVRALDAATGEVVWESLGSEDLSGGPEAVVADGTLYVGAVEDTVATLIAVDAGGGEERWRTAWEGDSASLSIGAASADSVYVQTAADTDVLAVDAGDGEERWRTSVEQPERSDTPTEDLALVGGYLYAGSVCLDPADGSVVWTHPMAVTGGGWWLGAATGGTVYVLGEAVVALSGAADGGSGGTATGTQPATSDDAPETASGTEAATGPDSTAGTEEAAGADSTAGTDATDREAATRFGTKGC